MDIHESRKVDAGDDEDISEPPSKKRRTHECSPVEHLSDNGDCLKEIRAAWNNMCREYQNHAEQETHGRDPNVFTCKIRKIHS